MENLHNAEKTFRRLISSMGSKIKYVTFETRENLNKPKTVANISKQFCSFFENSSLSKVKPKKNLKWPSMLAKRFVSANNCGRGFRFFENQIGKSHSWGGSLGLPSTSASIEKFLII